VVASRRPTNHLFGITSRLIAPRERSSSLVWIGTPVVEP